MLYARLLHRIAPIHALATKWNVFSMGTRASFATTISTHSRNLSDATCNVRNARMQHAAHSVQGTTVQNAHAKAPKSNSIHACCTGPAGCTMGARGALFRGHARMIRGAHAGCKLHAAPAVVQRSVALERDGEARKVTKPIHRYLEHVPAKPRIVQRATYTIQQCTPHRGATYTIQQCTPHRGCTKPPAQATGLDRLRPRGDRRAVVRRHYRPLGEERHSTESTVSTRAAVLSEHCEYSRSSTLGAL
jgi:hypothetical protein